jgi:membrane protein YdbS with pleckstrin-like domain
MGCLCILLLLIAMGLLASAAITFLTWAFGGMLSAGLLATASTLAVAAIAILVLWILVCRDCPAIRYLGGIFAVLAVAMLIAAGILALSGMPQGAVGALIDWALFTLVVAVLSGVGKRVGC